MNHRIRECVSVCFLLGLGLLVVSAAPLTRLEDAGIFELGNRVGAKEDGAVLEALIQEADFAVSSLSSSEKSGALRRRIENELRTSLQDFAEKHPSGGWAPSIRLWLADRARLRTSYAEAMEQYSLAWGDTKGLSDPRAQQIARSASAGLAFLFSITGRLNDLDVLENELRRNGSQPIGGEWRFAFETSRWARSNPTEASKCGLYCLDQLGRLTQPGSFKPSSILQTPSSLDGFSAADLVAIGTRQGLGIRAVTLTNPAEFPVPAIVHLRSDHFVILREKRGDYYNVYDTVAHGPRWLIAEEIAREASGCAIVSDMTGNSSGMQFNPMDSTSASAFRGRCHGPEPWDHDDVPCYTCPCPPGIGGPKGPSNPPHKGPGGDPRTEFTAQSSCGDCSGMPAWFVSDPHMNLWIEDEPLRYNSSFGPEVSLRIAYNARTFYGSVISAENWHGAAFGNSYVGWQGRWACSWLSFAEIDTSENQVEIMLPAGGWATFDFDAGNNWSRLHYRHNLRVQKEGVPGAITNLILHFDDGSTIAYGLSDLSTATNSYVPYGNLFYMTRRTDPSGASINFQYDGNFYLTNVLAADGTSFTVRNDGTGVITNVVASYGPSASFSYEPGGPLTNITDAAGISSGISYEGYFFTPTSLTTPYGTTYFNCLSAVGSFYRAVRITLPDGTEELYASMLEYPGSDWPAFSSSQIPTNTPLNTLDVTERHERNTFHWNPHQFSSLASTSLHDFTWAELKRARIRHWLASADPIYTHWNTLSLEQEPSPDGTTEGQVTWYDYAGKNPLAVYEIGTRVMPAVTARVMPDGSTWYQYSQRNTLGHVTNSVEKWCDGGATLFRTNVFLYAPNEVDLIGHIDAMGTLVQSNVFNLNHQVLTNYDALAQPTTYTYSPTTRLLTSISYPSGLTKTNIYDASYRLQQVSELPMNRTQNYTWYPSGNVQTMTDERGLVIAYYWDGLNRPTGTSFPDGTTTTNLYKILGGTPFPNSSGGTEILDLTATKDRMGHWTTYLYDSLRRRIAETNANNVATEYGYCTCGAVSTLIKASGTPVQEVTSFDYDYQGNLTFVWNADGYNVTNWYDSLGRQIAKGDGTGYRWSIYNNLGLLTAVTNEVGIEELLLYDLDDRPIYTTDSRGVTITNTYDALGRLVTRGYPDGGVEKFGYSARGLVAHTNQLGFVSKFAYDQAGRKVAETNANMEVILYTNNAAGDLISITDGKNQTTRWGYDVYGRVTNKVDQSSTVILRYNYDANSRLTNRWSAARGNTYYSYDAVGNLTFVNYPTSTDVSFAYDWLNRVTNMVDASGTTKYSYTAAGQLLTEDGPFASDTVTNVYQNRLRTGMRLQQPSGLWTNQFAYDSARRLVRVTSPAGSFTNEYSGGAGGISGFSSSLVKRLVLPNLSVITNSHDNVGRLLATHLRTSSGVLTNKHEYSYNRGNQRTNETRLDASTVAYRYDFIGQLKVADSSVAAEDRGYTYDAGWNLNFRTNNGVLGAYRVNIRNELTNNPYGEVTYDANGNPSTGVCNGSEFGGANATYDDENRLTSLTWADNWGSGFVYDGLGRLRKVYESEFYFDGTEWLSIENSQTWYVYDGMRVIQERSSGNGPLVSYTRGNDLSGSMEGAGGIGGLLARSHGHSGGNWSTHNYYQSDGNGNVTFMLNSNQAMVAHYRYDPFGNTILAAGALASQNVYRFSSKQFHNVSGLYYYGYRWYDPTVQRWVNRDPIEEKGGLNLYEFAANASVNFIDPDGRKPMTFPTRLPEPPSKVPPRRLPPGLRLPPRLGPVLGPIGVAYMCGALGAAAIDRGSEMIWPDNSTRSCNPTERKLCAAQCGGYKYIFMCTVTSQGTMICHCRTIPHPGDPKPTPPSWP